MTKNATVQVEEFTAEAQKTMEEGVEKMTKGLEEAASFGQENVDAMVEASKIAAKAAEDMNAELVAFSKKNYEDSMAAVKELTSCKSVTEYFEKQAEMSKSAFDGYVSEATKLNEMFAAATKASFEPLTARMNAAVDAMKTYRA